MAISEDQVRRIVEQAAKEIVSRYQSGAEAWLCDDANEAVEQARRAQFELMKLSLAQRGRMIE